MKEAVWVIGRGLLGSHVESRLAAQADVFSAGGFSWTDAAMLESEFTKAVADFGTLASRTGRYRIFWTAGRGIMSSTEDDMRHETGNLALFLRILAGDATMSAVTGTLALASSAGAVYAESTDETITEQTAPAPTTAYGRGKLAQETMVAATAGNRRGILIARIANLYGPGQAREKRQGLLTHVSRCMLTRSPIHIFVPFDTMRDYLHVSDAAADLVKASALVKPAETVIKIIASEEVATIASIVGIFKRITRMQPLLVTGTSALGASYPHRMRFASCVLTEARSTPRIGLTEGIAETFESERLQYAAEGIPR